MDQKEREEFVIRRFQHHFKGFPAGNIENGEDPPDFVVIGDKKVGIELTDFIIPKVAKRITNYNHITESAKTLFDSICDYRITVSVHFNKRKVFSKKDCKNHGEQLAVMIKEMIVKKDIPKNQILYHDFALDLLQLPASMLEVHFMITSYESESMFTYPMFAFLPDLSENSIQERIKVKEIAASNYKGLYDEIWLLLVEFGTMDSWFSTIPSNIKVDSSFDRVFIFRNLDCKTIELNIQR